MPRPQPCPESALAHVEQLMPIYHEAIQDDRSHEVLFLQQQVADVCGREHVVPVLMRLAGRYYAEKGLYKSALEEKQQLIDSLLAAPRRVARLVGRIDQQVDEQAEQCWAIIEGPPHQAVRFGADVDPEEICAGLPDEPVWVWLVESMEGASVAGRIDPPQRLDTSMERVMTFEGLVEGGDDDVQ